MSVPLAVPTALAEAGYRLLQQQRYGLAGCGEVPDLHCAAEWLLVHQQLGADPPHGLRLHDTVSSSSHAHDTPFQLTEPRHRHAR